MAEFGPQQIVLWIGAVAALLAGVFSLFRSRAVAADVSRYLLLAAGAAVAVAVGAALAALDVGATSVVVGDGGAGEGAGAATDTVHLGLALGWALATALTVVLLGRLAAVGGGLLAGAVALDLAAVAAAAGAAAVDTEIAGFGPDEVSLALWAASALLTLAVIVVLLRPLSGRASGLRSPGAALFSMLRNLLAGTLLLGVVVGLLGTGVLDVLPPLGTVVAWVAVQLFLAVGVVGITVGQRATLADVEDRR